MSSLVSDTPSLHSLANSLRGQEVSALTSNAFVIVVLLAVLDFAVSVFKFVWFVTFLADMVNFILASQDGVHDTDVVVETKSVSTVGAGLFLFI